MPDRVSQNFGLLKRQQQQRQHATTTNPSMGLLAAVDPNAITGTQPFADALQRELEDIVTVGRAMGLPDDTLRTMAIKIWQKNRERTQQAAAQRALPQSAITPSTPNL